MLANQPIMTNKFGLEPEQILRIEDLQDFMHALFPQKDVLSSEQDQVQVRKKMAFDPGCSFQKNLINKRARLCLKRSQLLDAFVCADLLKDIDL